MSEKAGAAADDARVVEYPAHWEADVVLRDGRTCHIRPIRAEDAPELYRFHENLSEETLYTRFFTANHELAARDVERLTDVDFRRRVALVAVVGGEAVGIGVYDGVDGAEAEIAFTIADEHQGRGIGSVLLEHLAAIARENGIHRFKAEVLSGNKAMLITFTSGGYVPTQELADGIVNLSFDIDPTVKSRAVAQSREHRAEALSIQSLLAPHSVAIVVDSLVSGSAGDLLAESLVDGGFTGRSWVVSPSGESRHGIPGAVSMSEIGESVDLVIAAVEPDRVDALVADSAKAGVRGIVLVTGGFAGHENVPKRHRDLARQIREAGMRLIGPNALGIINTDPRVKLSASLVRDLPARGRIGFFCQTGAFGSAILREVGRRGLGVSTFVSAGDRADVSGNDLLQYWEEDPSTSLVLLYLESIGNPRKFARIARRLGTAKPVVAVRSGRTTQALPLGHAVRQTNLPAEAVDAMFEQAGVIQVDTLTQLLDLAGLLALQPLPRGPRVAFISDSDALGMLALDASELIGLEPAGHVRVTSAYSTLAEHEALIGEVLADPKVDAVIITHIPSIFGETDVLREAIVNMARDSVKPLIAVVLAQPPAPLIGAHSSYELPAHGSVPVFSDVESALQALRSVVLYCKWLATPRGTVPEFSDLEPRRAKLAISTSFNADPLTREQLPLSAEQLETILDSYGIELWPAIPIRSEEEAIAAAETLGYPVVMKSGADEFIHRVDLGGIRLAIENEATLRTAYMSMVATLPTDALERLELQRMAPHGVACVAATAEDPLFGPVVSFRIAGDVPRLLNDYAFRIPPITDEDAHALARGPRAAPLLFGDRADAAVRGEPADMTALENLLLRLGQLSDQLPEIASLELNPIIVHAKGIAVLRATGTVARPLIRTDLEARRLL